MAGITEHSGPKGEAFKFHFVPALRAYGPRPERPKGVRVLSHGKRKAGIHVELWAAGFKRWNWSVSDAAGKELARGSAPGKGAARRAATEAKKRLTRKTSRSEVGT